MSELSKYAKNQFLVTTVGRYPLMGEILADTLPRATTAVGSDPAFTGVLANLAAAAAAWSAGETAIANSEAGLPGATLAFDDKMAALTRSPDAETPSLLETWETTIRGQVVYGGMIYLQLLPHGRETLTAGTRENQLDALRDFGTRLNAQATKPILLALGVTVGSYYTIVRALRNRQTTAKSNVEIARLAQETYRINAAAALYALIGYGMAIWCAAPARVDTLWDVNILRGRSKARPKVATSALADPAL